MQKISSPFPWHLLEGTPIIVTDANNYGIANVRDETIGFISAERAIANARLISAAPELLEALESLLKYTTEQARQFDGPFDGDDDFYLFHVKAARAAIAKAKGETE